MTDRTFALFAAFVRMTQFGCGVALIIAAIVGAFRGEAWHYVALCGGFGLLYVLWPYLFKS